LGRKKACEGIPPQALKIEVVSFEISHEPELDRPPVGMAEFKLFLPQELTKVPHVSSLNVAVVLTLITGFGGAVAGAFVFNAPWWSWLPMGVVGLVIGLLGAITQNQIRVRFLEKKNEVGKQSFPRLAAQLIMPFLAVMIVTAITVFGSIWLTRALWPEAAANPRSLGRLEEGL
jgi:hypothetical protein